MYAYSCCNLYIFAAIRMSEVSARFELARVRGVIGSRLYLLRTFFICYQELSYYGKLTMHFINAIFNTWIREA